VIKKPLIVIFRACVEIFISVVTCVVNFVLDRSELMATLDEISGMVDDVNAKLAHLSSDLDALAQLVANLHAGQVSQAQIDALGAKVENLQAAAAAVLVKEEGIA
jgi:outer membrane murein-binding lipoprotein Lpp